MKKSKFFKITEYIGKLFAFGGLIATMLLSIGAILYIMITGDIQLNRLEFAMMITFTIATVGGLLLVIGNLDEIATGIYELLKYK